MRSAVAGATVAVARQASTSTSTVGSTWHHQHSGKEEEARMQRAERHALAGAGAGKSVWLPSGNV
eukprot:COSAG06_NODE_456_length_15511_cov_7.299312_18_plen_65_part_00